MRLSPAQWTWIGMAALAALTALLRWAEWKAQQRYARAEKYREEVLEAHRELADVAQKRADRAVEERDEARRERDQARRERDEMEDQLAKFRRTRRRVE